MAEWITQTFGMSPETIGSTFMQILEHTLETVQLFGFTLLFALPLGLVLAFGRMSRFWPVQWLTRLYLLVMRGTPLMLQLIFFWFGLKLGSVIGFSRMQTAILAFSLNYAAYFAEIYRGGIEGVPHGPVGGGECARLLAAPDVLPHHPASGDQAGAAAYEQ